VRGPHLQITARIGLNFSHGRSPGLGAMPRAANAGEGMTSNRKWSEAAWAPF